MTIIQQEAQHHGQKKALGITSRSSLLKAAILIFDSPYMYLPKPSYSFYQAKCSKIPVMVATLPRIRDISFYGVTLYSESSVRVIAMRIRSI